MASHIFHEIYLHLNWHTKNSKGLLTPSLESQVHGFLADRCRKIRGVYFHEIGGTTNHIHLAINIEPHVCSSDLIGDLKGSCSFEINQVARMKRLEWQRGFGVVSFGKKQLPWVRAYIKNQRSIMHAAASRSGSNGYPWTTMAHRWMAKAWQRSQLKLAERKGVFCLKSTS